MIHILSLKHKHKQMEEKRASRRECVHVCVWLRMQERGEAEKINSEWLAFALVQESSSITNESGFCMLDLTLNGFATRRYHLWQFHREGQRLVSFLPTGNFILHRQIFLMYMSLITLSRWPLFLTSYSMKTEQIHLEPEYTVHLKRQFPPKLNSCQ